MDEARDIVLISFPFAAGVALAQFCPLPLFHFALAAVAVLMLLALAGVCRGRAWYGLLFFAAGVLCGSTGSTVGAGMAADPSWPAGPAVFHRALARTDALIRSIPFPHGETNALLRALLTGLRDGLPRETVASFRSAGASHILALSGLHLGIIYLLLSKLLSVLGNGRVAYVLRSVVVVAACAFYALMTGAGPSIVRALLFISINELMRHAPGRRKSPVAVWCIALLIQLVISPWVIRSVGFQLSYLAMLGIFLLFPWLDAFYEKPARNWSPMRWIWSSMALSISCQVFTAPLVWLRFGTFPKYFLLTNLIALPLTSALMFSAVACLGLSAFGICPAWVVWVVDTIARLLESSLAIIANM
jgi:competence protein ComEC